MEGESRQMRSCWCGSMLTFRYLHAQQRVADLQQELANVRVALLAATDDSAHRPDIGLDVKSPP